VKAGGGRGLEGRELAQVPRHQLTAGLRQSRPEWPTVSADLRYVGPRFEDARNRVRLGDAVVLDLTVSMQVGRRARLFTSLENAFGSELELARTSDE
jgi:outer membrane cobalamin receptor